MDTTSATRLLNVHQRLIGKGRPDSNSMRDVWAEVFSIPKDSPTREDMTIEAAMALRSEVDFARTQLNALDVPPNLTSSVFVRLRDAANPSTFDKQWLTVKASLSAPECGLVLSWSAWVLRRLAEPEVDQEEFNAIHEHLRELEEMLRTTEMPPALRGFVQDQVDEIRTALRLYPIQGMKVLKKAVDFSAGAYAVPDETVVEEMRQAGPGVKGILKKSMELLKQAAEVTGHVDKLKSAFDALANSAANAAPYLKELGNSVVDSLAK